MQTLVCALTATRRTAMLISVLWLSYSGRLKTEPPEAETDSSGLRISDREPGAGVCVTALTGPAPAVDTTMKTEEEIVENRWHCRRERASLAHDLISSLKT
jgi:hypothetical protein